MATYTGTRRNDILTPTKSNPYDEFRMKDGDDSVTLTSTREDFTQFFGDAGNDTFIGAVGDNFAKGGGGADTLSGLAGFDTLIGGGGKDTINGGDNGDFVEGGGKADLLSGGAEGDEAEADGNFDTFFFGANDSRSTAARVDRITDFNVGGDGVSPDLLVFQGDTGSGELDEPTIEVDQSDTIATIDEAREYAEAEYADNDTDEETGEELPEEADYVIVWNQDANVAFLVADIVNQDDDVFETGVVLDGINTRAEAQAVAAAIIEYDASRGEIRDIFGFGGGVPFDANAIA